MPTLPAILPGPGQYVLSFTTVVELFMSVNQYTTAEEAQEIVRGFINRMATTLEVALQDIILESADFARANLTVVEGGQAREVEAVTNINLRTHVVFDSMETIEAAADTGLSTIVEVR
jgi:hypothetical protein